MRQVRAHACLQVYMQGVTIDGPATGIARVVGNEDGIASPIPYAPLLF